MSWYFRTRCTLVILLDFPDTYASLLPCVYVCVCLLGVYKHVYINMCIAFFDCVLVDVQKGKVTPAVAAQMAEITLKACEPRVPKNEGVH